MTEERERSIFLWVAFAMMVAAVSYGLILILISNYNQKQRTDLPQAISLVQKLST